MASEQQAAELRFEFCPVTGELLQIPATTGWDTLDEPWTCSQTCHSCEQTKVQKSPRATHSLDSPSNRQAYYSDLRNFAYSIRWDHTELPDFVTEVGAKAITMLGLVVRELKDPMPKAAVEQMVKAVDDAEKCCIWVWRHFDVVPQHHKDRPGAMAFLEAGGQLKPEWRKPKESHLEQEIRD